MAHERGIDATTNRQRNHLDTRDENLYPRVVEGDWVFATNNESDFRELAVGEGLHPGLIVMPQGLRHEQQVNFDRILDHIQTHAKAEDEETGIWMINRVIEMSDDGNISHHWLPSL